MESSAKRLSSTSFCIDTNSDNNTPQIQLYIRKNNKSSYPYLVVDLTLNSSKTIFIVPACQKDDRDFKSKLDGDLVKKTFCFNNREWEEKEFDNYKKSDISQGYAIEIMSMMEKPPEGYE